MGGWMDRWMGGGTDVYIERRKMVFGFDFNLCLSKCICLYVCMYVCMYVCITDISYPASLDIRTFGLRFDECRRNYSGF